MNLEKRTILITGGAGYVGEMLCHQFSQREEVESIITIDKEPQSDFSKQIPKLKYIQANLADETWQQEVAKLEPDSIVHTAWQIRAMYGEAKKQWRYNVEASEAVFNFAYSQPSVKKLVYFSTASSYAARPDNTIEHSFTEAEGFREDSYIYAHEKKVVEEILQKKNADALASNAVVPQVTILRPAAITGPRGRYMRIRFGLQSALQGNLKGNFIYKLVTAMTSFVPATKGWVRQFIHEDDVNDIVAKCIFGENAWQYEVFNITPVSDPVLAKDMAAAVNKKVLPIQPWMARLAFFVFWHGTRGRVPTCPGSWRFYSYPIVMSGEKLRQIYQCRYSSKDAFRYTDGRYEEYLPEDKRNPLTVSK